MTIIDYTKTRGTDILGRIKQSRFGWVVCAIFSAYKGQCQEEEDRAGEKCRVTIEIEIVILF